MTVGQWVNVIIFSASVIPILLSLLVTTFKIITGVERKFSHKSLIKNILCNITQKNDYVFHLIIHWIKGMVYILVSMIIIALVLGALGKW